MPLESQQNRAFLKFQKKEECSALRIPSSFKNKVQEKRIATALYKIAEGEIPSLFRPSPTVLITTNSEEFGVNAAPFDTIFMVGYKPPRIGFVSHIKRDTFLNIQETGRFIINVPTSEIAEKCYRCAKKLDRGIDELDYVGLNKMWLPDINIPLVEGASAWIIVNVFQIVPVGERAIILGDVESIFAREDVLTKGRFDFAKAKRMLHFGGARISDTGVFTEESVKRLGIQIKTTGDKDVRFVDFDNEDIRSAI